MKKAMIIFMLMSVITAFAQGTTTGKIVIATEDTVITKDLGEGKIDVIAIVEEALEGVEGDIPREEIMIKLRGKLGDESAGVKRIERRIERRIDNDRRDNEKFAHYKQRSCSHDNNSKNREHCKSAVFFGTFMKCMWKVVVFVMWIVTLIVFGRGFSKIAASHKETKS